jgi:hypothetical protein
MKSRRRRNSEFNLPEAALKVSHSLFSRKKLSFTRLRSPTDARMAVGSDFRVCSILMGFSLWKKDDKTLLVSYIHFPNAITEKGATKISK